MHKILLIHVFDFCGYENILFLRILTDRSLINHGIIHVSQNNVGIEQFQFSFDMKYAYKCKTD